MERDRLWEVLRAELGELDKAIVGREAIMEQLRVMGVRTWSGSMPTWSTVRRWARDEDFPMLRGCMRGRNFFSSVTSQHAVTAWVLSRVRNGQPMRIFRRDVGGD